MNKPILDDHSCLTPEATHDILHLASKLACECPRHLIIILNAVREFKAYEQSCGIKNPKDLAVHQWLESSAVNFDQMISATISQLARLEGMIDEQNCIVPLGTAGADHAR